MSESFDAALQDEWADFLEQDEVAPGALDPTKFDRWGNRLTGPDWTDDPQ